VCRRFSFSRSQIFLVGSKSEYYELKPSHVRPVTPADIQHHNKPTEIWSAGVIPVYWLATIGVESTGTAGKMPWDPWLNQLLITSKISNLWLSVQQLAKYFTTFCKLEEFSHRKYCRDALAAGASPWTQRMSVSLCHSTNLKSAEERVTPRHFCLSKSRFLEPFYVSVCCLSTYHHTT